MKAGEKWKRVIRTATVDIALGIPKKKKMREKKRRQRQRKKEEIGTNLKDEWCENSVHFFKLQALTVYLYYTKKEMATHSQYPCLENPMDRGAYPCTAVHGFAQNWTQLKRLSTRKKWASQVALVVKNLPANAGDIRDANLIPGWARSPGEGNGNPLQYSCLGNPMDRGAYRLRSPWGHKCQT